MRKEPPPFEQELELQLTGTGTGTGTGTIARLMLGAKRVENRKGKGKKTVRKTEFPFPQPITEACAWLDRPVRKSWGSTKKKSKSKSGAGKDDPSEQCPRQSPWAEVRGPLALPQTDAANKKGEGGVQTCVQAGMQYYY
ncbi:hypothetical protein TWF173_011312 [Orbilia oligospora]|nr:hypothetical protein TWF173_011312 [Orbilia oligospora]